MAANRGATADLLAGDRLLARFDALQKIGQVVVADVEPDLRVLQKLALGDLNLQGAIGGIAVLIAAEGGYRLAADNEHESAAVHQHFAPVAKEMDAEPIRVFRGDAIRVNQLRAPFRSEEHTSELQSLRHLVCRL